MIHASAQSLRETACQPSPWKMQPPTSSCYLTRPEIRRCCCFRCKKPGHRTREEKDRRRKHAFCDEGSLRRLHAYIHSIRRKSNSDVQAIRRMQIIYLIMLCAYTATKKNKKQPQRCWFIGRKGTFSATQLLTLGLVVPNTEQTETASNTHKGDRTKLPVIPVLRLPLLLRILRPSAATEPGLSV